MASISIALSKGRIFDETAPLLARVGIRPRANPETSRKLVIATNRRDLRLIVVRASDTATYVQHGGADLGIAGRDVLVEHGGEGLYQPVDLGIARCRMVVAVRRDRKSTRLNSSHITISYAVFCLKKKKKKENQKVP